MIKYRFLFSEQILSELYAVFYLYIFICQQKRKLTIFRSRTHDSTDTPIKIKINFDYFVILHQNLSII